MGSRESSGCAKRVQTVKERYEAERQVLRQRCLDDGKDEDHLEVQLLNFNQAAADEICRVIVDYQTQLVNSFQIYFASGAAQQEAAGERGAGECSGYDPIRQIRGAPVCPNESQTEPRVQEVGVRARIDRPGGAAEAEETRGSQESGRSAGVEKKSSRGSAQGPVRPHQQRSETTSGK
jgi:hypothetical protein